MKQHVVLCMFVFVSVSTIQAQKVKSIFVKMNDNTVHEFKVDDIYEVTFCASEEDPNYPVAEAIDLGLPSGTKWASWNVGASKPEEYGGYYAWGETKEKDYYHWSTYKYCNGSEDSCYNIGDNIAGTEYDVAHVKWGGSWSMPSKDQIKELKNNCTGTWTTQNGVNGFLVTGPNGNTIFLPAAGYRWLYGVNFEGKQGRYWSSSHYPDYEPSAYYLYIDTYGWSWGTVFYRSSGNFVRPVCP